MFGLRTTVSAWILGCLLLSAVQAESGVRIVYSESLQQLSTHSKDLTGNQKTGSPQIDSMQFDAFGQRFDISLQPNYALLSAEKRQLLAPQIEIYRGEITGIPNSWVRLVFANGNPRGMLWDGQTMYAIDIAAEDSERSEIYRLDDLSIAPGTLSCAAVGSTTTGAGLVQAINKELAGVAAQGPGATSQIDIAVLGDFEFTSAKGASAEADMITRMNNVDGIFSSQLAVQLNVNQIDSFTDANDPFSDETSASALIDELADFRSATASQNANGLTHLFTGRNLDGTTVGIAFGGALCSNRFGAGLTQGDHSVTLDSLIAAHEIGHNFGAPHDGASGFACEAEAAGFLMAPSLNGSDTFSPCSITEMQKDIASASCIGALPSADVGVVASAQPATVLLEDSATIMVTVNGVGTDTATNVNLDISIPPTVTLDSTNTTAGSCTSGAANVTCAIGSVTAGSGVTVTVGVTSNSVGNSDFVASVTADVDANSNNNQATVQLVVDPAVDVATTGAAVAQTAINQSTTVRPIIQNLSSLAATGVAVTVTPVAGLNIDSASWSTGTCTVAANVATCPLNTLAPQSSETLEVQFTGSSEGQLSYTTSVTSNEADRDMTNNEVDGVINVGAVTTAPDPDDDDGGGGSTGLLALLLLVLSRACFGLHQRRSRRSH